MYPTTSAVLPSSLGWKSAEFIGSGLQGSKQGQFHRGIIAFWGRGEKGVFSSEKRGKIVQIFKDICMADEGGIVTIIGIMLWLEKEGQCNWMNSSLKP